MKYQSIRKGVLRSGERGPTPGNERETKGRFTFKRANIIITHG